MSKSYAELIDDHAHIERCADLLLVEAGKPEGEPERLVYQMHDLAIFVRDHIADEAKVIEMCDARPLPTPWRQTFVEGRGEFDSLCQDWLDYLDEWSGEAIECDRSNFLGSTEIMLARLKERLADETRALYSVALQVGAITFR